MVVATVYEILFDLLRCSVTGLPFKSVNGKISETEWEQIFRLAINQEIAPVLMAEVEKLPSSLFPPKSIVLRWFACKTSRESLYHRQWKQSCEFADAMAEHGVDCLVLKGFAVASYYPSPALRMFGDLDCYLVGLDNGVIRQKFEVGNKIAREKSLVVEESGYKHTHIHYKNLLIENHRYLTNFNETRQGVIIEKTLNQLALEGKNKRIGDSNLWISSPEFNALFLLKHSLGDFIANDMTLKSLYDWAMFLKAEQKNIDWGKMHYLLKKCNLGNFFNLMTDICVSHLGLKIHTECFAGISQHKLVEYMLHDILFKPVVGSGQLTFAQKIPNIWKRFRRQYKYRSIETENCWTLMKNTLLYSSFLNRKVALE